MALIRKLSDAVYALDCGNTVNTCSDAIAWAFASGNFEHADRKFKFEIFRDLRRYMLSQRLHVCLEDGQMSTCFKNAVTTRRDLQIEKSRLAVQYLEDCVEGGQNITASCTSKSSEILKPESPLSFCDVFKTSLL